MKTVLKIFILKLSLLGLNACSKGKSNETTVTATVPMIYGDVHDPAQLINIDNNLLLFASAVEWLIYKGNNVWELKGDNIYQNQSPSWYNGTALWAPSVLKKDTNTYWLYHSAVINEDNHQSRIGFAVINHATSELDFTPSNDFVLESENTNQPFAIDPAVFKDKDNRIWLVYGSHAKGIWIVELDEQTGLLKTTPENKTWDASDDRFTEIANYGGTLSENNIEAAYIYSHPSNGFYYLFVNWDKCCNGTQSTYNIRVGRATSPIGPFTDKDGIDLKAGGGSLLLDATGAILGNNRFIGPGHAGIYAHTDGNVYFSHHFYDALNNGIPSLAIWHLEWQNDWPVINTQRTVDL